MTSQIAALFLIPSLLHTSLAPLQATAPAPSGSVTVPAGTRVALKLISTIKSKSTRPGDPVRAMVSFPLAIGSQVAIPAGAFVEGTIIKINARPSPSAYPSAEIRFTRLLFANGYSVPLVATNTEAFLRDTHLPQPLPDALADARDGAPYLGDASLTPLNNVSTAYLGDPQSNPKLPPLPSVGPSKGEIIGIGLGATAGILILTLVLGHHRAASMNYVLFDAGWQFQMALQQPLTLDMAQVSAAPAPAN